MAPACITLIWKISPYTVGLSMHMWRYTTT